MLSCLMLHNTCNNLKSYIYSKVFLLCSLLCSQCLDPACKTLNKYLLMEWASGTQHNLCWAQRSPVWSVGLAGPGRVCLGPSRAGSLWPNSRLGESHHCPLCHPPPCLTETQDPSGASHRKAGPGQDFRSRFPDQRQPATPKGCTAPTDSGSEA